MVSPSTREVAQLSKAILVPSGDITPEFPAPEVPLLLTEPESELITVTAPVTKSFFNTCKVLLPPGMYLSERSPNITLLPSGPKVGWSAPRPLTWPPLLSTLTRVAVPMLGCALNTGALLTVVRVGSLTTLTEMS